MNWDEVSRITAAALDLPPSQRAALLAAEAVAFPEEVAEAQTLLAADAHLPALDLALEDNPALAPQSLGPYRLTATLASGLLGDVYRAERADGQFERTVAIKMLPLWASQSASFTFFFERERRLLAQLNHPHIARLYDSGYAPATGQPYVVMEFLPGGHLLDATAAQPIRQRASALAKVARAVDHAHQRSILHRDIKPSNILFDALGEPRLTDFGIAALAHQPADPDGLHWRTEGYTAPEILSGGTPTTFADIYSLGRVLASLAPQPDADLAAILARACHPDPPSRYPTAGALAADLEAYSRNEPVSVRPLSLPATVLRWAMLHPASASILVFTLVISLWAALLTAANWRLSQSVDELTQLTFRFDPEDTSALPASPALRRLFADRMMAALDRVSTQLRWRPEMRGELVRRYNQLAWLYHNKGPSSLNEAQLAETALRRALALAADSPEMAAPVETTLGAFLLNLRRPSDARPHFEAAMRFWASQPITSDDAQQLAERSRAHMEFARAVPADKAGQQMELARTAILGAMEREPNHPEWRRRAAHTHLRSIFTRPLTDPQVGSWLDLARRQGEWLLARLPEDPRAADLLVNIYLHSGRHNPTLAPRYFTQALDLLALWQQREPGNPKFPENAAVITRHWGELELKANRFAAARQRFLAARRILEEMPKPAVPADALDLQRVRLETIVGEVKADLLLRDFPHACAIFTQWQPALNAQNQAEPNKSQLRFPPAVAERCP